MKQKRLGFFPLFSEPCPHHQEIRADASLFSGTETQGVAQCGGDTEERVVSGKQVDWAVRRKDAVLSAASPCRLLTPSLRRVSTQEGPQGQVLSEHTVWGRVLIVK